MKQISGILTVSIMLFMSLSVHAERNLSGAEYSKQRLLLGETDYFVSVGAKSVYFGKNTSRETLDILAELTWQTCSKPASLAPETIAWMAKALGHSNTSRYTNVLDHCLSRISDANAKSEIQEARDEAARAILKGSPGLPFKQGKIDINRIKSSLFQDNAPSKQHDADTFKNLAPNLDIDTVFRGFGAPDSIKLTNMYADKSAPSLPKAAFDDHMVFKYTGLGKVYFSFGEKPGKWVLKNIEPGNGK